jgi:deazaflavin-dependent oxidoreductase (nitroreductase family)
MVLPRWLARLNKRSANKIGVRLVGLVAGLTVIRHRGRSSGRIYETPVFLFQRPGGYRVVLSYGLRTDWLLNLQAASGGQLDVHGRWLDIVSIDTVHDKRRAGMPLLVRLVLRLAKISDFVDLETADTNG